MGGKLERFKHGLAGSRKNRPTKCLLVTRAFPPVVGGSATVYGNLARCGGGAVVVLAPFLDSESGRELVGWQEHDRAADYRVYRIPLLRAPPGRPGSRLRALWLLFSRDMPLMLGVFTRVARIVRRERVAVVVIGEVVYGGWLAAPCRFLLKRKVVLYIHGEELTIDHRPVTIAQALRGVHLRLAHAIVTVSRFGQHALVEGYGIEPGKIELITNGIDLDRFQPRPDPMLREHYGLTDKRILLTVGRLSARKGIDRVIEALPAVRSRHPDLHYLIVGEGAYRAHLGRLVAERRLADHVTFAGSVSDGALLEHYAIADVFVMPHRQLASGDTEGFGVVFLEANACGVPAVAGTAGGAPDAVQDGVNGLSVDGDDVGAIAQAIMRILEDAALWERLRAGGLARARQADCRHKAAQFLDLCRRLEAPPQLGDGALAK
jgi:phosphatidylinositol alpha-1,6-mannosyltransferase